jgi:flagellar protein FlaI
VAFKLRRSARKTKRTRVNIVLKSIISRLRGKLERKVQKKVLEKAKEMKVDIKGEDLDMIVKGEVEKILRQEMESIEEATVIAVKEPKKTKEVLTRVLKKLEERLDQIMVPSMPFKFPSLPEETEFEGKPLKERLSQPVQPEGEPGKIGAPIIGGAGMGSESRYMVPFGFIAPMFKQMTGRQIIEKVQELYHVPFDQGEGEMQKINETYSLIPEVPKPGETVFAWAHIHWDPKIKELVYDVVEPVLSQGEKNLVMRLEDKLEEKLDAIYIPEGVERHKRYLRSKIKEVVDIFGWTVARETIPKIEYYIFRNFIGFGRVEPFMHDPNIEDISCDGINIPIYIFHRRPEYNQMKTNVRFPNKDELDSFAIKLAQKGGKSISVARPLLDASLPDGSRLQVTLGSDIARRGSNFTIRKFLKEPLTPTKLIDFGTASSMSLAYLWFCVEYGKSILISGTTATGKTSFLNAISLFIRPELKIVSIEDTAELMLPLPNWVPHVARLGYGEKSYGAVEMFDLLKAALRQRPDYVIVGEVRGKEASTMFQGMATGHPAISTMHADSLQRLVDRLTTPPISLSAALLENLDVVVFLERTKLQGKFLRRVNRVYEVAGVNVREAKIIPNKLFEWDPVKDDINMTGKSAILKKIADFRGIDYETIHKELERRALFLEWLKMNNVLLFRDFGAWVRSYYLDTKKVMEMVINDVRRKVQKESSEVGTEEIREPGK